MCDRYRDRLIKHINRKDWWHVPPLDPQAFKKRGKFLSSTFKEAEFYGRPLDRPQNVHVLNPLIGDEDTIEKELLGRTTSEKGSLTVPARRFALDAKLKRAALAKGYDSIALLSPKGFESYAAAGKIPSSIELNVLKPCLPSRESAKAVLFHKR